MIESMLAWLMLLVAMRIYEGTVNWFTVGALAIVALLWWGNRGKGE